MTTNTRLHRRRSRAAERLEAALAPDSGHRFGTWKRFAVTPGDPRESRPISDDERDAAKIAARQDAEVCLANLRRKNVLPAGE